jgi:hypothetical protein
MALATAATFADGGLGTPEVVIIFGLIGVPLLLVLAIVWAVRRSATRG